MIEINIEEQKNPIIDDLIQILNKNIINKDSLNEILEK